MAVDNTRTLRENPLDLDRLFRLGSPVDESLKRQITARVKEAREAVDLSQEEMAALLGLTHRAYQWYESQKNPRPPFRRLGEIAEITGVTQEWLLRGDPAPPAPEPVDVSEELAGIQAALAEILRRLGG
ncbi:MAG: helix-turn-helix domain-containing protein [Sulfuricaulis sp.]